jgi:hypothetical protein
MQRNEMRRELAKKMERQHQRDKLNEFISELRDVYDQVDNWKDPEEIEELVCPLLVEFNKLISYKSKTTPKCWLAPTPLTPPVKVIAIPKAQVATNIPDVCAICLTTHLKCDSITTDCGHQFGEECWTTWSNISHGKPKCAMCNKQQPNIIKYRPRKQRISKPKITEVISVDL